MNNGTIGFARVRYFCQVHLDGGMLPLAIIDWFEMDDAELYHRSAQTLNVSTLTGDPEALEAVHYLNIASLIAAPPCPTSFDRDEWHGKFFIAEKMGLSLAWLGPQADDEDGEPGDNEDGFDEGPSDVE